MCRVRNLNTYFFQTSLLIVLLFGAISCNYRIKSAPNFKEQELVINNFYKTSDTNYLNKMIDSLNNIKDRSVDEEVFVYYLDFLKYTYNDYHYGNFPQASTLVNYIEKNNLVNTYYKYYTDALFSKGDYFFVTSKFDDALKTYVAAKNILDIQNDTCAYNTYYNKMWNFYYYKNEYEKAIPYLKEYLLKEESCKGQASTFLVVNRVQSRLNTLALCYEKLGKYDSAIYYYKRGINFLQLPLVKNTLPPKRVELALGIIYGNLGGSFAYSKQTDSAIYYLKKSIKINEQPGYDTIDVQTAYLKLADVYLNKKEFTKAKEILNYTSNSINSATHPTTGTTRVKYYLLDYNYYIQTNQYEQAIKANTQFFKIQDSVSKENNKINNFSLSKEVENIKNEFLLKEVEKKNEIKNIYIFSFLSTLVFLIGLTFFIYRYGKQNKKTANQAKLHNLELQNTLQELELSNKNYVRVMRVMAHDLRSPLAGISGIANILITDSQMQIPERKEMVKLIRTSCTNSLEMIDELMQTSTSIGTQKLNLQLIDIVALLKDCIKLLQFKALEKQQTLNFRTTLVHHTIQGDNEKLWRLFSNLIVNAIKFSHVNKSINIYLEQVDENMLIKIQDQGIGIPEKSKEKVFEMFTDAKRKGTNGEQTYGLGLHICKQITLAHKGKIWFESVEGVGTTFFVLLPIENV